MVIPLRYPIVSLFLSLIDLINSQYGTSVRFHSQVVSVNTWLEMQRFDFETNVLWQDSYQKLPLSTQVLIFHICFQISHTCIPGSVMNKIHVKLIEDRYSFVLCVPHFLCLQMHSVIFFTHKILVLLCTLYYILMSLWLPPPPPPSSQKRECTGMRMKLLYSGYDKWKFYAVK